MVVQAPLENRTSCAAPVGLERLTYDGELFVVLDEDTVLRYLLGNRARILAYVRSIVRDEHLAEDVFQDVSILAVKKRDRIANVDHLAAWMRTTARFESLAALRRENAHAVILSDEALDALDEEWSRWDQQDANALTERLDALRACMETLSPYTRKLVELRYERGLSGERLAAEVSRNVNTVYRALSRAHGALADCVRRRLQSNATE